MRFHHRSAQLSIGRRRLVALAAGCVVALAADPLFAQAEDGERGQRAHLVYRGHDGCPDAEAFRRGVVARTSRARFVTDETATRRLEVDLAVRADGTRGRLVITDLDADATSRREVSGDDCAIVVDALALVAALAIDPAARLTPRPEPAEVPAPAPASPSEPAPRVTVVPPPIREAPPTVDDGSDLGVDREPGVWRPLLAAQVHAVSGFGRLAPIVGGFVEVGLDRPGWLSPSFRASLFWMPPVEIEGTAGAGSFWRWGGQASVCPVGPRPAEIVVLRPCVGFELGALKARGVGLDESNASSTAWAAVALAGRTQVFPSDWMLLELHAELGVPLIRPRYLVEPDATVVQLAPVYGAFGTAFGVRLP